MTYEPGTTALAHRANDAHQVRHPMQRPTWAPLPHCWVPYTEFHPSTFVGSINRTAHRTRDERLMGPSEVSRVLYTFLLSFISLSP